MPFVPLSITARQEELKQRPQCFSSSNTVSAYNRNGSIPGFEDFLLQKEQQLLNTSSEKRQKHKCAYYKVNDQNSLLVHMPVDRSVTFCGYLKVTIIFGSALIFGYKLSKKSRNKHVTLFGSKEFQSFSIKTIPHKEGSYSHLKDIFKSSISLSEANLNTLLSSINLTDSILLIEEVSYPNLFLAKQYIQLNLFPINEKNQSNGAKWLNSAMNFTSGEDNASFKVSDEWQSMQLGFRNIIIGGEGTGKSTLSKYVVNRLLNANNTVLYLELDIGQGEFIPPGCVGLILIRQPIFGPNFAHIIEPERMIHLGDVNPGKCSSEYLASVELLVNDIENNFLNLPLVVNTMGYCKGLGLHLMMRTINTLRPSTVIQINSDTAKKNFEKLMTPEIVSNKTLNYNFCVVQSLSSGSKRPGSKREARERMLISYFSSVLSPPYFSFNTAEPYCVPFGSLSIGVTSNIAVRDVLSALNGCLVALCEKPAADATVLRTEAAEWFTIVLNPSVQHCLGLGLVRGIDMENSLIYILTPLNIAKLLTVRLLQMSHVEVPSVVFTKQEGIDGLVPYITKTNQELSLVTVKRVFRQLSTTQPNTL